MGGVRVHSPHPGIRGGGMGRFLALANSTLGSLPPGELRRRPQPSGFLEMGSGERDGVRVWLRRSTGTSAVARTEKKEEGGGGKSE